MIDFIPVGIASAPISVAGAGSVLQNTYTVPPNKRALLTHSAIRIELTGAAINTAQGLITATVNGVVIEVLRLVWLAGGARLWLSFQPEIDMIAADTVQFFTINTAAVNVTMGLFAVVREYNP